MPMAFAKAARVLPTVTTTPATWRTQGSRTRGLSMPAWRQTQALHSIPGRVWILEFPLPTRAAQLRRMAVLRVGMGAKTVVL
jgi:hypothetical protein